MSDRLPEAHSPAPPVGSRVDQAPPPKRRPAWWQTLLSLAVLLVLNYLLVSLVMPKPPQRVDVPYTLFKQQAEAGNVAEVMTQGDTIQGSFKQPVTYPVDGGQPVANFATVRPSFADQGLENSLEQQGVVINARSVTEGPSWWVTALLSFGPALLLIGGLLWLGSRTMSQAGGGVFSMGRSNARRYQPGAGQVTFADVAGIDEAKNELVEVVDFLKEPGRYTRLGGTAPKGVLLVGPPGTGKTLLARAVAGEAGVPFLTMGASEFVEMIVGVGASRVRDLFRQAREAAPAIVFIDELDAVGRARGGTVPLGGQSEQEQTLDQILAEMDGFTGREGVIVLAATNRPDVLDPALLRPGRFDRRVVVQPPDRNGREAILKIHTRGMPLAPDVDLKKIAAETPGLVGADLRNLVNEAALLAARRKQDRVVERDVADALEKILLGPARQVFLAPDERERVAYHEGGHTICGLALPEADPVQRVTIMPRGLALGVTYQRPGDERHNYSEPYLRARIATALGGRAAEEVVYGVRSTGSEADMQQITELARQMVTRWGMSDRLGPVTLAEHSGLLQGDSGLAGIFPEARAYSERTAQLVDSEVQRILEECYAVAVRVLQQHRHELNALAKALLECETLDEAEIRSVTGLGAAGRAADAPVPLARAAFSVR
jgi:cell division protease FtsH